MTNPTSGGGEPDRQRLMPGGHWTWRTGAYSTLSQGWRVGNIVFVGGQVALDRDGAVIGVGDIATQTRVVYEHIGRILEEAGAAYRDVVKINSYLVLDPADPTFDAQWEAMATVRRAFFPEPGPCGTGVIVPALVYPGLLIEVECIAVLSGASPEEQAAAALT